MPFTLLPAVDVAGGQAVWLVKGAAGSEISHGDPREVALGLQAAGAEWIHLVDVDAAFGRGSNTELLKTVIDELDVKVQVSGGISDEASLEQALASGCTRVNLGTAALDDPAWCTSVIAKHAERIAVSLDVRLDDLPDGSTAYQLSARGGTGDSGELWATVEWLDAVGCARYVVTDVGRDGSLLGPNVQLYEALAQVTSTPVIASGGIASLVDLAVLAELAKVTSVEGAVLGRALHAGNFTLAQALDVVRTG